MSEREKLIEVMARAWMNRDGCGYEGLLCNDVRLDGRIDERGRPIKVAKNCTCYEGAAAALAAIEAHGAEIAPVEATDEMVSAGTYHLADHLCASEYVNGPDASVVLALAHTAFVGAFSVAVAANPYRRTE